MSSAATPAPAPAEAPAAPARGPKLIIVGAFAGLLLGGAVGGLVIAPRLGNAQAEEVVEVAADEHGSAEPAAAALVHQIENLVVNPASTNGARFLLVTTAIVVVDAASLEELKLRDAEIRDRIVDLLSGRTIDELADPSRREALKTDLATAIGALFEKGVVTRVLLPQFVIQ